MNWVDRVHAAVRRIDIPGLDIQVGGRYSTYLQFSTRLGSERADVLVHITEDRRSRIDGKTVIDWVNTARKNLKTLRPQWRPELAAAAERLNEMLAMARIELEGME